MRRHGLTNFPDVTAGQGLPILHENDGTAAILINGVPQPVSSPKLNSAMSACANYMREFIGHFIGGGVTPGSIQQALVKTAACMRGNGVPDYPDPPALGTVRMIHMSPTGRALNAGIDVDSPAFKAAVARCGSIMNHAIAGN